MSSITRTKDCGYPRWVRDATLNDSDKSFTVPTGKVWELHHVKMSLTATATVGNRPMTIAITDGTNELMRNQPVNVAASQTGTVIMVFDGSVAYAATALFLANVGTQCSFGKAVLPAGYVVRCYDSAAIDAAADDVTVVLHYTEYDA